jgi:hypothetical protein
MNNLHLKYRLVMAIPFVFTLVLFWVGENTISTVWFPYLKITLPLGIPFWAKVMVFSETLYLPLFMCRTVRIIPYPNLITKIFGDINAQP